MTLVFHALWLLCGIGSAVFAALSVRGRWSLPIAIAGFALGAVASRPAMPDPAWLGTLAALVAVMGLAWPRHWILTSATAGLLAGVWSALLQTQALPQPAAWIAAASVPAVAAWLAAWRPFFAPPVLRDEALLVTFVVAVVVAMMPGIADGWRAALQLNMPVPGTAPAVPLWALLLGLSSMAGGGVFSVWRRR